MNVEEVSLYFVGGDPTPYIGEMDGQPRHLGPCLGLRAATKVTMPRLELETGRTDWGCAVRQNHLPRVIQNSFQVGGNYLFCLEVLQGVYSNWEAGRGLL